MRPVISLCGSVNLPSHCYGMLHSNAFIDTTRNQYHYSVFLCWFEVDRADKIIARVCIWLHEFCTSSNRTHGDRLVYTVPVRLGCFFPLSFDMPLDIVDFTADARAFVLQVRDTRADCDKIVQLTSGNWKDIGQ